MDDCSRLRPIRQLLPLLAALLLNACASYGDFGRPRPFFINDEFIPLSQVPQEVGLPIGFPLTDEEKRLRDYAYPLILPPEQGVLWTHLALEIKYDLVLNDDGRDFNKTCYGEKLMTMWTRSQVARYSRLIGDIQSDMMAISRFYGTADQVSEMDRKRVQSLPYVAHLTEFERANTRHRVAENAGIVDRVCRSLHRRIASYRYALERLAISSPSPQAADAERVLIELERRVAMVCGGPQVSVLGFADE